MNDKVEIHKASDTSAISFSENALRHIQKEMGKQEKQCLGLRFSVSKTGCSGLSYVVDYVFEEISDDKVFEVNDWLTAYIEKSAYPYLKGLHVDFRKEGLNHKFVFTNPNQTGACGCGESFTIDERFS